MECDDIVPRKIPNQNIIAKIRNRELNFSRRSTASHYSSDFHKCIHPNLSVISVGRPRSYLRKFSPDGKYFIGFSIDQNYLEIYRYNGPCAASKFLAELQAPNNCEHEEFVVVSNLNGRWKLFEQFFTLKHRVAIGEADYQVNRECCLFSTDNRFVIVASSAVISDDRAPVLYESRRSNESPTLRVPLENILVEMVELDTGMITDRQRFDADKIVLSHNAGFHLYEDTFAVMSVQQQIIHIFRISSGGMFLPVRKIGRFCFDDDELTLGPALALHPYEETCLGSLKQRILTHLFKKAKTPEEKRRFARNFEMYVGLRMWKMQLLDANHLLIKYASEEVVSMRRAESSSLGGPAAAQPAFLVIYEMTRADVLGVYENSSSEFLGVFERFSDFFYASHFVSSPNVSVRARKNHFRWKQTMTSAKYGGPAEATKRLLAQLPVAAQAHAVTPYLDVDLYSYDEKYISQLERPKPCSDAPLRFYDRESGLLKFKIVPSLPRYAGGYLPSAAKRLIAFAFHPTDPFAISVQRTHVDYVINIHVRRCLS